MNGFTTNPYVLATVYLAFVITFLTIVIGALI